MKRVIISVLALVLMAGTAFGQTQARKKVAVVPTIGTVSDDVKGAVQDALEEGIANSGGYTLVARGTAYEQALKEFKFQETGAVADNQLEEFGHAVGADFVCYANLRKVGSNYRISYKMINVATSEVPRASSKSTQNGEDDLLEIINIIAGEMFGGREGGGNSRNSDENSRNSGGKKNGDVYNPDGIELVYVEKADGKGFYIGKYEITQAQYQKVTGVNPSYDKAPNKPVEQVSWNDAQEFLSKLNSLTGRSYRLPSEAEWVYAANGGLKNDVYEYAGSNNIHEVAWFTDNSGGQTHPVGTKSPNSIGIYDMSGNVWEWCQDDYDGSGSYRVSRGGSYGNIVHYCGVADRYDSSPGARGANLGFRVVLP